MKTQYLVTPRDAEPKPRGRRSPVSDLRLERQTSNARDVIPGFLDLPSGTLEADDLGRYLKVLALFSDHILIPDGWLHCMGPLSEHMRRHLRAAQAHFGGVHGDWFASQTVPSLLRAGIIIPGLRGRRPRTETEAPLGFDLYDVWAGNVRGGDGALLSFGVAGLSERDRMAILDPTPENHELVRILSRNTAKFVDWTAPTIPADQLAYDQEPDRQRWDVRFANIVSDIVLNSPTQALATDAITFLRDTGSIPTTTLVKVVTDYYGGLIHALKRELQVPEKFRRGSVERAVAEALGLERLHGYDDVLKHSDATVELLPSPMATLMPGAAAWLRVRPLLGRILLDQVTLSQEAMFAEKFHVSLGLGRRPIIDLIDRGLMPRCGLEVAVPTFVAYSEEIIDADLPLERLTANQIIDLRGRNEDFFNLARQAVPSERFWQDNPDFAAATRRYVCDIAASIPLSTTARAVIAGTRKAAVSAVATKVLLVANPWFAGLEMASLGFPIVWYAQKVLKPVARLLTANVDVRIENLLQKCRRGGYADLLLQALDLSADVPETIQNEAH